MREVHEEMRSELLDPALNEELRDWYKSRLDHDSEQEMIESIFEQDGVYCGEAHEWNRGFLPVVMPSFAQGIPLHLDPKYCRADEESAFALRHPLSIEAQHAQRDYFSGAQQAVTAAWPMDALPDRSRMRAMWQTLAHFKNDGVLVDGWNDHRRMGVAHGPEMAEIFSGYSDRYAARLAQHQQQR